MFKTKKQRVSRVRYYNVKNLDLQLKSYNLTILQTIKYNVLKNSYFIIIQQNMENDLFLRKSLNINIIPSVGTEVFIIQSLHSSVFKIKKSLLNDNLVIIVCLKTGLYYYINTLLYNKVLVYYSSYEVNSACLVHIDYLLDANHKLSSIIPYYLLGHDMNKVLAVPKDLEFTKIYLMTVQLLNIFTKLSTQVSSLGLLSVRVSRAGLINKIYLSIRKGIIGQYRFNQSDKYNKFRYVRKFYNFKKKSVKKWKDKEYKTQMLMRFQKLHRLTSRNAFYSLLVNQWSEKNEKRIRDRAVDLLRFHRRWFDRPKLNRWKMHKKFFQSQITKYRHITKHRLFITLFRGYFKCFSGFDEKELMYKWFQFRRKNTKFWTMSNLVHRFSQSLLLTTKYLILFLGFTTTIQAADLAAQRGIISVNGRSNIHNYFLIPGDTMQILPSLLNEVKLYYSYQQWNYLKLKISYIRFLLVDWSMLMFTSIEWPKKYELYAPSYLSERWIRFYIRHFPVRQRKYQTVKKVWRPYPRPHSVFKDMTGYPVFSGRRRW